ncbi:unnamed protein product [Schistosoma haematobium]|nr:unnamed protein product [Schistosoma haematobium]CAH8454664.1 unnamed protein product [Schistosoma haematobium]
MLGKIITHVPNFLKRQLIYPHHSLLNLVIGKADFSGFEYKGSDHFLSYSSTEKLDSAVRTSDQHSRNGIAHLSTIEDLKSFVSHPSTTVNDILDIDIRLLPSEACAMCLEALLRMQNQSYDLLIRNAQNDLRNSIASGVDWPSHYIKLEHITKWHKFDVGSNLFYNNNDYSWMKSEKFDLLVLTTAACANGLSIESLLRLAGYFGNFWERYEPKVYASVLRHINNQELRTEIHLLGSAIAIRLLSGKEILCSVDPTVAIRLLYDIRWALSYNQRVILFDSIYYNLTLNNVQWNLYTVAFLLLHSCKLMIYKPSVIKSCLAKISRKLRISDYHPSINQSQWINAILAALANYTVNFNGASGNCEEELQYFIKPPCRNHKNNTVSISKSIFIPYEVFTADWVQRLFSNICQHVTSQQIVDYNSLKCLAQITYSLSLFGHKADSLIEYFNDAMEKLNNDVSPNMSTSLATEFSQLQLYMNMAKCLLTPLSKNSNETEKLSVSSLPSDYWRFYYHCGFGLLQSNEINDPGISKKMINKRKTVNRLYHVFLKNSDLFKELDMDTFQCILYPNSDNSNVYFADILFKQVCGQHEGKYNYVICIVHENRDEVAKGPLLSLLNFYRETQCLPVLTFNICTWNNLPYTEAKLIMVQNFLREVSNKLNEMNNLHLPEIYTTNLVLHPT